VRVKGHVEDVLSTLREHVSARNKGE